MDSKIFKLLLILSVNAILIQCQNDNKVTDLPTIILDSIKNSNANQNCDRGHVNDRFCDMENEMKAIQEDFQNIQEEKLQLNIKIEELQNEIKDISAVMKEMQNQILELQIRPCAC